MIAWPRIPAALLALLPTVPGWSGVALYDGEPIPNPPSDEQFFTVGYSSDSDGAGTFTQEVGRVDGLRDESGEVRCELTIVVGQSDDLAAVYATACGLLDALDEALRANQTLDGVLGRAPTVLMSGGFDPVKANGTAIRVPVLVQYFTRSH